MQKHTDSHKEETQPRKLERNDQPNLTPGLDSTELATKLNERLPLIKAVIERKEKSQTVTQDVMLLEFNY